MFLVPQVLYLVDPIDELAVQNLKSYKEKNFVDISKEDLDLGKYFDHYPSRKFLFWCWRKVGVRIILILKWNEEV